jgi:hypothetical protein
MNRPDVRNALLAVTAEAAREGREAGRARRPRGFSELFRRLCLLAGRTWPVAPREPRASVNVGRWRATTFTEISVFRPCRRLAGLAAAACLAAAAGVFG